MDQRKKGTKPPFFRNNTQGQPTSREPIMFDIGGQRLRRPPIQCWGCKGDHMFRDCPHRGEKVRIVHNVQSVETVEDMGRNVPNRFEGHNFLGFKIRFAIQGISGKIIAR